MSLLDEKSIAAIGEFSRVRIDDYEEDRRAQTDLALLAHRSYANTIYPPLIISEEICAELASTSEGLIRLIRSIPDLLFGGDLDRWVNEQGFTGGEADFLIHQLINTPTEKTLAVARADALVSDDGFKYVEVNISPALGGLGICDGYSKRIKGSRLFSYLSQRGIEIVSPSVDPTWMKSIRKLFWPNYNSPDAPLFFEAIADPAEAPEDAFDRPEWLNGIRSDGFLVMTGHVSQLKVTSNGVFVGTCRVDVVYFCFTYQEMIHHKVDASLILALSDADHAGVVNLFTSFATIPYDNKVNFAFLTDERNRDLFSNEQLKLINTHIPKSTVLNPDTLAFAKSDRNSLVLKAGADFGGAGVFIGSNTSSADWNDLLLKALSSRKPYIIQELICDVWVNSCGDSSGAQYAVCIAPLLFGMRFGGILLRTSPYSGRTEIMNVAKGSSFGTGLVRQSAPVPRLSR